MTQKRITVAQKRKYRVENVKQAKEIAHTLLEKYELDKVVSFGLPEIDDRYHIWRVPLKKKKARKKIGEIIIDAKSSLIDQKRLHPVNEYMERTVWGLGVGSREKSFGQRLQFGQPGGKFEPLGPRTIFLGRRDRH